MDGDSGKALLTSEYFPEAGPQLRGKIGKMEYWLNPPDKEYFNADVKPIVMIARPNPGHLALKDVGKDVPATVNLSRETVTINGAEYNIVRMREK